MLISKEIKSLWNAKIKFQQTYLVEMSNKHLEIQVQRSGKETSNTHLGVIFTEVMFRILEADKILKENNRKKNNGQKMYNLSECFHLGGRNNDRKAGQTVL